jgi:molybdate transport system substrate-binding protein
MGSFGASGPERERARHLSGAALLVGLCAPAGCSCEPEPIGPEVVVYADASVRDALLALEEDYERDHAVDLVFELGSSAELARAIVGGAEADLFLSADELEMDRVEAAGLVAPGTRRDLVSNRLVVIVESEGANGADGLWAYGTPFAPADLAGPAVERLALADVEGVPEGRHARAWLERLGIWPAVRERVLSRGDARAALEAVESGAAEVAIVYRTDALRSEKARIVYAVPAEEARIVAPLAILAGRPAEPRALALALHLASPSAQRIFEKEGFVFLPEAPPDSE